MAERRIRYSIAWIVFLAVMFTAAGLMLSPDSGKQLAGLLLLLVPGLGFGAIAALYYWRSRRMESDDSA